jgi:hypothetical protein
MISPLEPFHHCLLVRSHGTEKICTCRCSESNDWSGHCPSFREAMSDHTARQHSVVGPKSHTSSALSAKAPNAWELLTEFGRRIRGRAQARRSYSWKSKSEVETNRLKYSQPPSALSGVVRCGGLKTKPPQYPPVLASVVPPQTMPLSVSSYGSVHLYHMTCMGVVKHGAARTSKIERGQKHCVEAGRQLSTTFTKGRRSGMMESREHPSGHTGPGRHCRYTVRPGLGLRRLASACPLHCTTEIAASVVICTRQLAVGK